MVGCLSANILCPEQANIFQERSSRKTESFEEQITSKEKYFSIFSCHMEAIVLTLLSFKYFLQHLESYQNWQKYYSQTDILQF